MTKEVRQTVRANTEVMKEYLPYNREIEMANGKKVFISDFADLKDLPENLAAAKKMALGLEKDIYIRPHVNVDGYKNPELGIGSPSKKGDLKTLLEGCRLDTFLLNGIKSASRQGARCVVCDISIQDNLIGLSGRLFGSLNGRNKAIKEVVLIKGNMVVRITRKQIEKQDFAALQPLIDAKSGK